MLIELPDPGATRDLGRVLAQLARPGDIICLIGDLGAGKTALAQGLAAGLEVREPVTSPTFTLIHEYQGRLPFYHFDLYRLQEPEEADNLGMEEYLYGSGLSVIEWPELVLTLLPSEYLKIYLEKTADGTARRARLEPAGAGWRQRLEDWAKDDCVGIR